MSNRISLCMLAAAAIIAVEAIPSVASAQDHTDGYLRMSCFHHLCPAGEALRPVRSQVQYDDRREVLMRLRALK
jgi:hypothetical protein